MKTMQSSDELMLRRYLLGELKGNESRTIEQRLLTDQQCFTLLLKIEEELTDEYVRGILEPRERREFEQHFAASPERRDNVEFAKALRRYLSQQLIPNTEPRRAPKTTMLPAIWRMIPAVATAAMLLLLASSVSMYWQMRQIKREVDLLQVQRTASERQIQELTRQVDQQRARGDVLATQLENTESKPAELKHPHAAAPGSQHQEEITVAYLTLLPGLSRNQDVAATAKLTPLARSLRLELNIGNENYTTYQAELQTVEGEVVWSRQGLKRHGGTVAISLPTALLSRSDYLVMLRGSHPAGASEKAGTYYFRVMQTKN